MEFSIIFFVTTLVSSEFVDKNKDKALTSILNLLANSLISNSV
jgi:hypothetical protein